MDLISEILGCFFLDLYKQITDNSCGYLHSLFLPNSNKCFLYVYLPYMHYLVLTLLATRHFLQFTMFGSISELPFQLLVKLKHFLTITF